MANLTRNFTAGRMNKVVDERLVPNGEYIDALNIRMGSTEMSEIGVIENTKGNLPLTQLKYNGVSLSPSAKCIGALEDGTNETIYWFIHDSAFVTSPTGKLDLICSYNVKTNILTYHIISLNDGTGDKTTLNFDENHLITGVNIIENLLFFTDDLNPPRKINVNKNYANPTLVSAILTDGFSAESILVIKKPPVEAPAIQPIDTSGQENFLEDKFICFAYRYQYEDGEYSATSQWSEPAFFPKQFEFSTESFLNEGMTNAFNGARISYNSGDSLVVGIDLLFKEANNSIIKVIEKLDKSSLGLNDNTVYTYDFVNSKIFTILPESEILRLYDSVPLSAKAQTVMGNRLMYGNYVEGYDMVDAFGEPVNFEYSAELVTEDIGLQDVNTTTGNGLYTIDGSDTIPNSVVYIDLSGQSLSEGSSITLDVTISHESFSGDEPFPTETTDNISLTFNFYLQKSYASVYELATSDEFQLAIGTASNIQTVANACNGNTFTDSVNCLIPQNLGALTALESGISAAGQGIGIIASPSSDLIGLQFNAMRFVDDIVTPTQNVYEYYQVTFADASFQDISDSQSLHSNRDYEIGIVYMDDFNRSSTAMVSPDNTVHVPCGNAKNKNSIQVTIPPTQKPPYWATRYKFVAKSDKGIYDTIYSNLFFEDPETNEVWFYLEGENARKVEVGDRYVVKADTSGPLLNCAYATVLAKESQAENFITPIEDVKVPAGVYMKINPNSFSVVTDPEAVIAPGSKRAVAPRGGNYAKLNYPMNIYRGAGFDPMNPSWEYDDFSVPAGSLIKFFADWYRAGVGGACELRGYLLDKNLVSLSDYDNMEDWFNGENIASLLNTGTSKDGDTSLEYIPTNGVLNTYSFSVNYLQFYRNPTTNQLILQFTTGKSCTGINYKNSRAYSVTVDIEVFRALNTIIFETEAQDSLPDVFFENHLSFPIVGGNHMGNVQNQDINLGTPAIIDTEFFNCYSFGNGAESCKIRDSITGDYFDLGNRVTTTSAQDYRRVDRFADITYSGVYNTESNVNKLNEFNAGLLNYKNLEVSFGSIEILYARETDILALQEDKISYVLAGKNLLSDAAAGGAITSVPEVLGTQIARMEEYGISKNPESFASWGYDKYFTDAKRGAVIQLRGSSYNNETLKVVSELGMRSWFRDLFNESFNTQKIGGYDPYMNEYVLSSNDIAIPTPEECVDCGITKTISLSTLSPVSFCNNLGQTVGQVDVSYEIPEDAEGVTITVDYNGNTYTTGTVTSSGTLSFEKDSNTEVEAIITISTVSDTTISLTFGCPQAEQITVISVCVTSNSDAGKFIHNEYRYQDGIYTSPLQSEGIAFSGATSVNPVSQYTSVTGPQGFGSIPTDGATVTLYCNKIGFDNFVFNPSEDKFKYLRSNTLYDNNELDIAALLAAASDATPIDISGAPNVYSANFVMPSTGQYLYLIYDYRNSVSATLCYSNSSSVDACCGCTIE